MFPGNNIPLNREKVGSAGPFLHIKTSRAVDYEVTGLRAGTNHEQNLKQGSKRRLESTPHLKGIGIEGRQTKVQRKKRLNRHRGTSGLSQRDSRGGFFAGFPRKKTLPHQGASLRERRERGSN